MSSADIHHSRANASGDGWAPRLPAGETRPVSCHVTFRHLEWSGDLLISDGGGKWGISAKTPRVFVRVWVVFLLPGSLQLEGPSQPHSHGRGPNSC